MHELKLNNLCLPEVIECGHFLSQFPFFHADRTVDFNVLIYVVSGVIYVTEDNIDYEIKSDELLFLKSGIHHFGKFEIPKGTEWYYAHFHLPEPPGGAHSQSCSTSPLNPPADNAILQITQTPQIILPKKITLAQEKSLLNRLDTMIQLFNTAQGQGTEKDFERWRIPADFFYFLFDVKKASLPAKNERLSDRICRFLDASMQEPFSASMLEEEFFLSYKRLALVFKQEKGCSMQQYHTKIKMQRASELLATSFMTVKEISDFLGYQDQLYFSRIFKMYHKVSPREYRKTCTHLL